MLINGRFLSDPPGGAGRFALELLAALGRRGELGGARLCVPPGADLARLPADVTLPVTQSGRRRGSVWEQFELPSMVQGDWLVSLCGSAPLLNRRQVVLLQDTPLGRGASGWRRAVAERAWMRRAACVATPTRHDAQVLLQRWGARAQGVEVIPPGGDHILRSAADRRVFERLTLAGRRYVLAVEGAGTDDRLAGFATLLARSADPGEASTRWVRCGPQAAPAGALRDPASLQCAGVCTDGERRALYEGAACLLLTRLDDVTLLTALEAMSCGCAVIALQHAALAEVCGEAALYFNPTEPASLVEQLRRVLGSTHLTHGLRAAGYARARSQTWDRAAQVFSALGQRLAVRHP